MPLYTISYDLKVQHKFLFLVSVLARLKILLQILPQKKENHLSILLNLKLNLGPPKYEAKTWVPLHRTAGCHMPVLTRSKILLQILSQTKKNHLSVLLNLELNLGPPKYEQKHGYLYTELQDATCPYLPVQ